MQQVILYGAGALGQGLYAFLRLIGRHDIVRCFCDANAQHIVLDNSWRADGVEVRRFDETVGMGLPYVITIVSEESRREVAEMLTARGMRYHISPLDWLKEIGIEFDEQSYAAAIAERDHATIKKMDIIHRSIPFVKRRLDPARILGSRRRIKVRIYHMNAYVFNSIQTVAEYLRDRDDVDLKLVTGADADAIEQAERLGVDHVVCSDYDIAQDAPDVFISNYPPYSRKAYEVVGGFEKLAEHCRYIAVIPFFNVMMGDEGWGRVLFEGKLKPDSIFVSKTLYDSVSKYNPNVYCMPNPKFDTIYNALQAQYDDPAWAKISGKRAIIWAPDHGLSGWFMSPTLSVDVYFTDIISYFRSHPKLALIFRPHRWLIRELVDFGIWSRQDLKDIRRHFDRSANIIWDDSNDYASAYARSDAVMTDPRCGIIYSYLATKKPILSMFRDGINDTDYNPDLSKHYYKAYSWDDVRSFIEMIARGEDPLYEDRMRTFEEYLPNFDGRYGARIGEFIIEDYLCKVANEAE